MLSKSGIHAVRALIYLAELPKGQFAGAASVAGKIDAPKNYLGKILQQLSRDGVLVSQKGLGGGFRLAKRPKDISLFDVIEPIEQISRWNGCILGGAACSELDPCAIHDRWRGVVEAYMNMLTKTTLADLARQKKETGK